MKCKCGHKMNRLLSITNYKEVWYCSDNCGRVLIVENSNDFKFYEHSFVPDIEQFHVAIVRSKNQVFSDVI